MKRTFPKVGFRLRALRRARHWTQETLAAACQCQGFAVTRAKLAKYEIGLTEVPARFIPIFAHILKADITELLPPIGNRSESRPAPEPAKIRNLTGHQIQAFRKKRKWSQDKLAAVIQETGAPATRAKLLPILKPNAPASRIINWFSSPKPCRFRSTHSFPMGRSRWPLPMLVVPVQNLKSHSTGGARTDLQIVHSLA